LELHQIQSCVVLKNTREMIFLIHKESKVANNISK